jgi:hypothetical protein
MSEQFSESVPSQPGRDILAEMDSIKEYVEVTYGKEEPSVMVTPLSRFEEHWTMARGDLEMLLAQPAGEGE